MFFRVPSVFMLGSLRKMGEILCKQMAARSVWLVRWLYLSIVKTDGHSGKQFPILDSFHQSKTYLVMIGDVMAPTPPTSPIRLF